VPVASIIGDTFRNTSMRRPSLRCRTVSWCSTRSPHLMRAKMLVSSSAAPVE
jgi:hypothetical protein